MSTIIKPTKLAFKKAEAEWHNYHNTLKEIERLREEIMNPYKPSEDVNIIKGANSVKRPGDPTGITATRLTTHKQLNYLTEVVKAIENVYGTLSDEYRKLVKLRYWNNRKLTWDVIADELHVNRTTAMRWRDEIIIATIELLGWR